MAKTVVLEDFSVRENSHFVSDGGVVSLAALRVLVTQAAQFESYSARCARRNAILFDIYLQLSGPHWSRLAAIADEIVEFRQTWRQYQYAVTLPKSCNWIEQELFRAAKVLDKIPPSTSRGLHAALKSSIFTFSISQI